MMPNGPANLLVRVERPPLLLSAVNAAHDEDGKDGQLDHHDHRLCPAHYPAPEEVDRGEDEHDAHRPHLQWKVDERGGVDGEPGRIERNRDDETESTGTG